MGHILEVWLGKLVGGLQEGECLLRAIYHFFTISIGTLAICHVDINEFLKNYGQNVPCKMG